LSRIGAREVLTLAYMNGGPATHARRRAAPWSAARREWHKEKARQRQNVRGRWIGGILCWRSERAAGLPHRRADVLSLRDLDPGAPYETLPALERRSSSVRASARGLHTVELLDDPPRIGEKVMEEAEECGAPRGRSLTSAWTKSGRLLYHCSCCCTAVDAHRRRRAVLVAVAPDAGGRTCWWSRASTRRDWLTAQPDSAGHSFVEDCERRCRPF